MATQLEEEKTASDVDFSDVDDSLTTLITNYKRRPLDRYLRPLQQRLTLKAAVFVVPDNLAKQALLLLEQAQVREREREITFLFAMK